MAGGLTPSRRVDSCRPDAGQSELSRTPNSVGHRVVIPADAGLTHKDDLEHFLYALALAPISAIAQGDVRWVIRRMKERLSGPKAPRRAADVLAAAYVLLGLRYTDEFAYALFEEVLGMEESSTYRAIVRRGRAEEGRHLLLLQGNTKFGPPDDAARSALEGITDLAQFDELAVRLMTADSWQELLPASGRTRRRRTRENG